MKKTFRKSVQDLLSVRAGRLVNLAGVFLVAERFRLVRVLMQLNICFP